MYQKHLQDLIPHWILHSKNHLLAIIGLQGELLLTNKAFQEKFSVFLRPDSLTFQHILDLKEVEKYEKAIESCIKCPDKLIELSLFSKTSDTQNLLKITWEFSVLQNNHQTLGIVCMGQETPRSFDEIETELRRKNQLLNGILESPKGIIIFSLDTEYRYSSFTKMHQQVMKRIWGVEIAIGDNMLEHIKSEEDRIKAKRNFDKVLRGEYLIEIEEYGDENLHRTHWENRYSPIFDEHKNIVGLTVFVTDITEIKMYEHKIIQQNEKLKEIAWKQSHEVRRPLANILGLVHLMSIDNSKMYEPQYVERLKISAEELDEVVSAIVRATEENKW
jgi:PAS domain S-box-containing protein